MFQRQVRSDCSPLPRTSLCIDLIVLFPSLIGSSSLGGDPSRVLLKPALHGKSHARTKYACSLTLNTLPLHSHSTRHTSLWEPR